MYFAFDLYRLSEKSYKFIYKLICQCYLYYQCDVMAQSSFKLNLKPLLIFQLLQVKLSIIYSYIFLEVIIIRSDIAPRQSFNINWALSCCLFNSLHLYSLSYRLHQFLRSFFFRLPSLWTLFNLNSSFIAFCSIISKVFTGPHLFFHDFIFLFLVFVNIVGSTYIKKTSIKKLQ